MTPLPEPPPEPSERPSPARAEGPRPGVRAGRGAGTEALRWRERLDAVPVSAAARRMLEDEIELYERTPPGSAEAARLRAHVEWTLALPWAPPPDDPGSPSEFARVRDALNRSHTGLELVKERVLEFLAVRVLHPDARGAVLCFAGPPGTGKSSMGRAVARALGRELVEVDVGGIDDETEFAGLSWRREDGHPGILLGGLARARARNPVVLIDEIDRLLLGDGESVGGSLLELLDRDRNHAFHDAYLGVPFDLSQALIVVTANDADEIPEALADRLEVVEFCGYTEREKFAITREHLLPRARAHARLERSQLKLSPAALRTIVRGYTEEGGVRQLQRRLDALVRKAAMAVVQGEDGLDVRKDMLLRLLGPAVVDEELGRRRPAVGTATGLAWTSAGGSLLPVEALSMPGEGRVILTGQVGDVLRESVQTVLSWVKTCMPRIGLDPKALDDFDVHLHLPSAATPKDGPSAGAAIAVALMSLLTGAPARHDVALSGEVSLHGEVLPVGGLRDKLLAALRGGLRTVIVPLRNSEEILRLPGEIKSGLEIRTVGHVHEVFEIALTRDVGMRSRPALFPRSRVARRARGRRSAS